MGALTLFVVSCGALKGKVKLVGLDQIAGGGERGLLLGANELVGKGAAVEFTGNGE